MILPRLLIPLLLALAFVPTASALPADTIAANDTTPGRVVYEAEAMASVSAKGGYTPFWLVANRAGLGSVKRNTGLVRAAIHRADPMDRHFGYGFGADIVGAWRAEAPFLVRELYGEVRYRAFRLTVGSKLEDDRLVDIPLSSGDLLFSSNSVPIPQVKLSMPRYMMIPGLRDWLGFKAYVSFGAFTDTGWQASFAGPSQRHNHHVLYHSKGLRLRIGRPDLFPLVLEGGMEMAAQFGGKVMMGDSVIYDMPSGFKDIIKVLIPQGGGGDSGLTGEQLNVLGNHVGQWSARLMWQPKSDMSLAAYYLHYFDDHSMMTFDYIWHDGLLGLEFRLPANRFLSKAVYEYLYTKNQSGAVYWDKTPEIGEQVSGRDDYYNHYIYRGWHHWGMGIGNPLIISPVYNSDGWLQFQCNRVISHHIGLSGEPAPEWGWRFLASWTRGWGTYKRPYSHVRSNVNLLGEVSWAPARLAGWSATLGLGLDRGSMTGHSFGAMLSIKKTGSFSL